MGIYDDAKQAIQEAHELREKAIAQLLAERADIDRKLADLGHGSPAAKAKPAAAKKATGIAAVCQVCGFGTEPPHDQRFRVHKDQPEAKPLTAAELKAAGLVKK
jgi:hypothetical protein